MLVDGGGDLRLTGEKNRGKSRLPPPPLFRSANVSCRGSSGRSDERESITCLRRTLTRIT
jgi:hypothetical protein